MQGLHNVCNSLRSPWHKAWLMFEQLIVQPAHEGNSKQRIPTTEGLTISSLRYCNGNEAGCAAFYSGACLLILRLSKIIDLDPNGERDLAFAMFSVKVKINIYQQT